MTRRFLMFVALATSSACLAPAQAQNAYRCGNSYSQTPCPGAVSVDISDPRSREQKAQAAEIAQREQKLAETMERSRLDQEEAQRQAAAKSAKQAADKPATKEKEVRTRTRIVRAKPKAPDKNSAKPPNGKKDKTSDAPASPQTSPATMSVAR